MEKVGIMHLAGKMINEISDGERQRAMIAKALAQDTPVIMLDEPTAFLDISNTHAIFHLLHLLARVEQKTVILSTHDLNIALREMDKLWIMLERETMEGAPEDAVLKGWLSHLFHDEHVGFNAGKRVNSSSKRACRNCFGEREWITLYIDSESVGAKGISESE